MQFVQHIVNGLLGGFVLALVGLGFSMVWGILNIINLAHAAFIMLGAFTTYYLWERIGLDPFLSLPLTMIVIFIIGFLVQFYVINLVIRGSLLVTFLLTFGIEGLAINLALRFFSANTRQTRPFYANESMGLGPIRVSYTLLAGAVVTLLLTLALYLFLDYTKTGRSIRAVGLDQAAARLMGVDIGRTYALTFGIGAALAAAAGALISTANGFSPGSFDAYNVLAFSVVVLGGLGSIPGALLGGLAFGMVNEFASVYALPQRDVVVFTILILVLVLKPTGLLGREGYNL
ncbi:MAG TPA: branched-chain amino acid ABC transporter permease [Nitrolancea sp.]|nr:branched-chain amino acid ABC transporter permease [Nitrolancea sp.]